MVKIGDRIRILNEGGQYDKWVGRLWTVDHIARSVEEHRGYDTGVGGNLISCKGLPVSLYDWEFEVVGRKKPAAYAFRKKGRGRGWFGNKAGHRKAAKKGKRRKR